MIIIRPLLLFLGFIFQYIPFLQFFGVAILFFTYFALIRRLYVNIWGGIFLNPAPLLFLPLFFVL